MTSATHTHLNASRIPSVEPVSARYVLTNGIAMIAEEKFVSHESTSGRSPRT